MADIIRRVPTVTVRCCRSVQKGFHSYQCSRTAKIEENGRPFCAQHDPQRQRDKRQAELEQRQAATRAEDALKDEAERLIAVLGCGQLHYQVGLGRQMGRYTRHLLISFEDAQGLSATILDLQRLDNRGGA